LKLAHGLPELMFFEESPKWSEAILALLARDRVSNAPHPSWLSEFKSPRIEYNFMYFMFYMTSLPEGIRPELILTCKFCFCFLTFFCSIFFMLLTKSNKTETLLISTSSISH
jgi:hypothetical protein